MLLGCPMAYSCTGGALKTLCKSRSLAALYACTPQVTLTLLGSPNPALITLLLVVMVYTSIQEDWGVRCCTSGH